eukprot:scaffold22387_cov37-Phaeocystis_antarctica.AAC.3
MENLNIRTSHFSSCSSLGPAHSYARPRENTPHLFYQSIYPHLIPWRSLPCGRAGRDAHVMTRFPASLPVHLIRSRLEELSQPPHTT